jgi:V/A-type H+/Na+-transporting ATPase subunit D
MDASLFPTKGNLLIAKSRLALSKQGYDLLDKKRNILVREIMLLIDQAKELQGQISSTFAEAYSALQLANISLGISTVDQISKAIILEDQVTIKVRSIMGVEIPVIGKIESEIKPQFGFARTNESLDIAYKKFHEVKQLSLLLAEIENAVYRLAINIKRTQKRANALKNVMIPKYEKLTKSMINSLEEKEREEFSRLKTIKNIQTRSKN